MPYSVQIRLDSGEMAVRTPEMRDGWIVRGSNPTRSNTAAWTPMAWSIGSILRRPARLLPSPKLSREPSWAE